VAASLARGIGVAWRLRHPHQAKIMRTPIFVLAVLAATAVPAGAEPRSGAALYQDHCAACHHPSNVMVSSPKAGSDRDWAPRLQKGLPGLTQSAVEGFEAMPPKGNCEDCTPSEIEAAIRFMANIKTP
jgi:cytochrome c5